MKDFRSKASRQAARAALRVLQKRDQDARVLPKVHTGLTDGAEFIHGGPLHLKHPRWTR